MKTISCQRFEEIAAWISQDGQYVAEQDYDDWIGHADECAACRAVLSSTCNEVSAPDPLAERISVQISVLDTLAKREGVAVQDLPQDRFDAYHSMAHRIAREWSEVQTVN